MVKATGYLTAALVMAALAPVPAAADLIFPSLTNRTGPYASGGAPLADGYSDYFTLLNERDGGINGVRIQVPECETGYNADKGVECYESMRSLGPVLVQPMSGATANRIIPKAVADGVPVHSMGHAPAAAADGTVFPWVFNFPGTSWDAASIIVRHMLDESGGSLAGKRIALVYHNSVFGQEPIRALRELARKYRFALRLYPVDHPGQEQKAVWAEVERAAPEFIALWGWGMMTRVALEEARNISYPMDRIVGVWWSASEVDIVAAGEDADGYKSVLFHGAGAHYPLFEDLRRYVFDTGKGAGDGALAGTAIYNLGLYAAVLAAEAVRAAMRMHDTTDINAAMMRDGMEQLVLDQERMTQIGLPDFGPQVRVSCADHGGPGIGAIHQWTAASRSWKRITADIQADRELLDPQIRAEAAAYARGHAIVPVECAQ